MKRAVIFMRVSTDDQTTANQLPTLRRMAAARGLEVVAVIEETISGAKKRRPELQRLLEGAHRGEYNVVVVSALDRLGRTMVGVVDTVTELDRLGCRIISHSEPWLDTDGPVRPLLLAIFAWVAEQERRRLIERTVEGVARARREGKRLGRPRVTVDLDAALKLRRAGASVAETARKLGVGERTLARALASERLPKSSRAA